MKQYCRYCCYMVCGDINYCTEQDRAVNFYIRLNMGHGFRTSGEKVGWKNDVQGREKAYASKKEVLWMNFRPTVQMTLKEFLKKNNENKIN